MLRRGFLTFALMIACSLNGFTADGLAPASEGQSLNMPKVGIDQKLGDKVPLDLVFRDETGQAITLAECVNGKPTILVMAYYRCPMLCNQVLNGLLDAMRSMAFTVGKEFNVVVVSFDPKEQPELASFKKKSYLDQYSRVGADAGWRFLTGKKASIDSLTDAVGFRYEYDRVIKEYIHGSGIMVLTPDGTLAKYFYGIKYDDFQSRDLRLALVEASEGKIGTLSEQLMLMCYRYDHSTGKYSFSVMLAMRIAGIITMVVIAVGLVVAFRREKRKKKLIAAMPGEVQ